MNDQFLRKKFIFNDNIDGNFLFDLYEDDFLYIQEIFRITLDQLNTLFPEIKRAFENKDINELKQLIHKIKPAFGFTGFLITEEACKQFEDACSGLKAMKNIAVLYQSLWKLLSESMDIMRIEYDQLKEFNSK